MVVQRRHFEKALAVGGLEVGHLDDVGQGFQNIDNAHQNQNQGHIHREGQGRHRAAHEKASGVSHKDLGRVVVIAEKGRQPARQGEGGLWAVDQWLDVQGTQYLYFPDSGKPAAEHYADLQAACDAGEHPELLTPAGAAAAFVADYFDHETAEGSFERVPEVDQGYMERNQRLQQLVLDLEFRPEDVGDMDLLSCVGEATGDNWGVLGRFMYGSDWFNPLMDAVAEAAVGDSQQDRDRAVMSFFLATRDARTDFQTPLGRILVTQAGANLPSFEAALAELPEKDRERITQVSGVLSCIDGQT